jgi:hypothetical protein
VLPRFVTRETSRSVSAVLSAACCVLGRCTEIWCERRTPTVAHGLPPPIESRKSSQSVNPYYVWLITELLHNERVMSKVRCSLPTAHGYFLIFTSLLPVRHVATSYSQPSITQCNPIICSSVLPGLGTHLRCAPSAAHFLAAAHQPHLTFDCLWALQPGARLPEGIARTLRPSTDASGTTPPLCARCDG